SGVDVPASSSVLNHPPCPPWSPLPLLVVEPLLVGEPPLSSPPLLVDVSLPVPRWLSSPGSDELLAVGVASSASLSSGASVGVAVDVASRSSPGSGVRVDVAEPPLSSPGSGLCVGEVGGVDDAVASVTPTSLPWSSNCATCACEGTRTGTRWLKDGLPARPATAGAAATHAAAAAAEMITKRFTECSSRSGWTPTVLPHSGDQPPSDVSTSTTPAGRRPPRAPWRPHASGRRRDKPARSLNRGLRRGASTTSELGKSLEHHGHCVGRFSVEIVYLKVM
ncbi:MAG: hypothetical protein JWO57_742, partial [Pseudonocardiales bacterium]|nr:hypothetical protein [Pseudonocardiales bacterium]